MDKVSIFEGFEPAQNLKFTLLVQMTKKLATPKSQISTQESLTLDVLMFLMITNYQQSVGKRWENERERERERERLSTCL